MPTHSIASRRQRRKSRPPTRAPTRAQPAKNQGAPKPRKAPQPPYPAETSRIARAATLIAQSSATGMARYALFCLALLAEEDLSVSLAHADLAVFLGMTTESVRHPMRTLRTLGELVVTREHRGRLPTVYRIVPAGTV